MFLNSIDVNSDLKGESELGGDSLCHQTIGKVGKCLYVYIFTYYIHLPSKAPGF